MDNKKNQNIVYKIDDIVYLNITNRCTNTCTFCIRYKTRKLNNKYSLWLSHEPNEKEVIKEVKKYEPYKEIAFVGYGEPLLKLNLVKNLAGYFKRKGKTVRIDTNGHANLVYGRDITKELKGLVDIICISLNVENKIKYDKYCQSIFGIKAYDAIIDFIKRAKISIPKVIITVVGLPGIGIKKCEKIAKKLNVGFRVRPYYLKEYKY